MARFAYQVECSYGYHVIFLSFDTSQQLPRSMYASVLRMCSSLLPGYVIQALGFTRHANDYIYQAPTRLLEFVFIKHGAVLDMIFPKDCRTVERYR
jgi:hypothetical protein